MSKWKFEYKAISKNGINYFNEELKKHIDEGYMPFGSISIMSGETDDKYCILMFKSVEIKEDDNK